jgi:hypothetical protein
MGIFSRFEIALNSLPSAPTEGTAYAEPSGQTATTTKGDFANEETSVVVFGTSGGHVVRALERINVDILLVHQSKVVAFNIITRSGKKLNPIGRSIKNLLLSAGRVR